MALAVGEEAAAFGNFSLVGDGSANTDLVRSFTKRTSLAPVLSPSLAQAVPNSTSVNKGKITFISSMLFYFGGVRTEDGEWLCGHGCSQEKFPEYMQVQHFFPLVCGKWTD